jgi:hypothetical protein
MKRAFAKAGRDSRGIEGPGGAIRSPAIADGCALPGIESRAGAETELANNVLRSCGLIGLWLRIGDVVRAIRERYYVVACFIG